MQTNAYIDQITESLRELNPYLVLLFGSYAYGTPHEDSDIDLLVVTRDDFMPSSFDERSEIHLAISKKIRPIMQQIAVDLLVYTLPMYQKFIELNSSFAKEITQKGIVLYEGYNKTVA